MAGILKPCMQSELLLGRCLSLFDLVKEERRAKGCCNRHVKFSGEKLYPAELVLYGAQDFPKNRWC